MLNVDFFIITPLPEREAQRAIQKIITSDLEWFSLHNSSNENILTKSVLLIKIVTGGHISWKVIDDLLHLGTAVCKVDFSLPKNPKMLSKWNKLIVFNISPYHFLLCLHLYDGDFLPLIIVYLSEKFSATGEVFLCFV